MKLSVIIPCYNASDTLADQLEALAQQRWSDSWEVIVADNGSTDELLAVVERYRERIPNLRVADASDRRGIGHALNVAAEAAVGEALVRCDADDVVAPGWLAAMGEALTKHDFVACRFETFKLNPPWLWGDGWNPQQDGVQEYNYPPFLPHAGGGSLGVKRALHEAVGGFDSFIPALEDTDYCWRIQLAGTKLHFVPDAVVHIRLRNTLYGIFQRARFWGKQNVFIYKRYRPLGMPKLSWKCGIMAWANLLRVRSLLQLRRQPGRAALAWELGWRIGRLQGSIKQRVFAL